MLKQKQMLSFKILWSLCGLIAFQSILLCHVVLCGYQSILGWEPWIPSPHPHSGSCWDQRLNSNGTEVLNEKRSYLNQKVLLEVTVPLNNSSNLYPLVEPSKQLQIWGTLFYPLDEGCNRRSTFPSSWDFGHACGCDIAQRPKRRNRCQPADDGLWLEVTAPSLWFFFQVLIVFSFIFFYYFLYIFCWCFLRSES